MGGSIPDRDRGLGHDRGLAFSSPQHANEREADRGRERSPEQVVQAKFVEAKQTLEAIADVGIPKLAAAQPFAGDRRGPRKRRAEYDLAKEGIASQLKHAEAARTTALAHARQHGIDTTALVQALAREVAKTHKQLAEAPTPPPGCRRRPGSVEI